ncbi:uncharacterized protein GLRG_11629 [Colletotrichum graminicola M1.001]|uniref:Tat pathway signal sequence n=1 Tax=Colletotrichum graminicola (strain M1.001 / M2 / FGSC 10212) TaxID=645133 RepID=E3R046_COLGM|nr:uncharacterized protein GLRG_11629 [Colletotrichum graminicola M1.001]EFQ36484.1 hypothetical protein GLRG_11629 [Colletotrichum graminicola M1.001]
MLYKDQYASLSSDSPDCISDGEPEQYPLTPGGVQPAPPPRKSRNRYTYAVLAVLAQLVYTIVVLVAARTLYYKRHVLEYKEVPADHKEPDEHHPYLGTPRPELDRNWNTLLSSIALPPEASFRNRVPGAEVSRLGIEEGSIWLDDDVGQYYGSVWVGHNLHCVKYLYNGLHRDHYYHNMTEAEEKSHSSHLHHCLHRLMDALKCHPDMSPLSLHWVVNEVAPVVNWDGARHTCANWDRVMDWARSNQIVPAGKASLGQVAPHPLYATLLDENGHADFLNQDAIVEWEKLFARPDWQAWAKEHGVPEGTIPDKEMLRNHHVG